MNGEDAAGDGGAQDGAARAPAQQGTAARGDAEAAWNRADWHGLAQLAERPLENEDRRVRLALLACAGLSQIGEPARARSMLRRAVAWGGTREEAATVLLSSAADALGRAACHTLDETRADGFFRQALDIAGRDPDAAPSRRLAVERELGAAREAAKRLREEVARGAKIIDEAAAADLRGRLAQLSEALDVQPDALTAPGRLHRSRTGFRLARPGQPFTVAVATAPRSGSTWLYNAVNRILDAARIPRHSAWCEQYDRAAHVRIPVHVVKLHEPRHLPATANLLVTTERALDERLASLLRMGWVKSDPAAIRRAAAHHGTLSSVWLRLADCAVDYADLTGRPEAVVARLAEALEVSLTESEIAVIAADLATLSAPERTQGVSGHDPTTLMHPGHRADSGEQARHLRDVRAALEAEPPRLQIPAEPQ